MHLTLEDFSAHMQHNPPQISKPSVIILYFHHFNWYAELKKSEEFG